jgi:hypothetical protein
MLMALQKNASCFHFRPVTVGEIFYRLGVLSCLPPLSLVDMFHAIGEGFGT